MKSADPDVNQHACLNEGPYNPHPAGSQYGYEIAGNPPGVSVFIDLSWKNVKQNLNKKLYIIVTLLALI